jgi:hypothetical protein
VLYMPEVLLVLVLVLLVAPQGVQVSEETGCAVLVLPVLPVEPLVVQGRGLQNNFGLYFQLTIRCNNGE